MRPPKLNNDIANTDHLKLTIEDIETIEEFKKLSPEQKQELILLVYELSRALYHLYSKDHE